jgi:hypothetical protein
MHHIHLIIYLCAGFDEDRRFAIGATAHWECGILDCEAKIGWDNRLHPKRCQI